MCGDGLPHANIEPADVFVLACGREHVEVTPPYHAFDGPLMCVRANLKAARCLIRAVLQIESGTMRRRSVAVRWT